MISLVQAVWASITLYQARGDQIDQYSYAAFGLTVAPYAWMSVVNIVANLLTPEYPCLFLVRTPLMDRAEADGGFFEGGLNLEIDSNEELDDFQGWNGGKSDKHRLLSLFLGIVPLAIVGILSKFRPEKSASIQRGFTMSWLVIGIYAGLQITAELTGRLQLFRYMFDGSKEGLDLAGKVIYVSHLTPSVVASIGGMVVVGSMIKNYGICTVVG
jgi:hypothetical protein